VDRQCPSCGGFCKKSGCERDNVKPKEWVGLESDEQILEISKDAWGKDKLNRGRDDHRSFYIAFARAIEAKLKEKNA